MFETIRSQFSPQHQTRFDRSVVATTGLLFGVVVCTVLSVLSGRPPLSLDLATLTLYSSVLPLSVFGFMRMLLDNPPRLPMLATLWFLACFAPLLFFGEALFGQGTLYLAGFSVFLPKLVGFRIILAAALAGAMFSAIRAEGFVGEALQQAMPNADWEKRHQEAVRRLAMMEVDLRTRRAHEDRALAEFDRRLARESRAQEGRVRFAVEDEEEELELVRQPVHAAA